MQHINLQFVYHRYCWFHFRLISSLSGAVLIVPILKALNIPTDLFEYAREYLRGQKRQMEKVIRHLSILMKDQMCYLLLMMIIKK